MVGVKHIAALPLQPQRWAFSGPVWSEDLYDRVYKPRPRTRTIERTTRSVDPRTKLPMEESPEVRKRLDKLGVTLLMLLVFLAVRTLACFFEPKVQVLLDVPSVSDPTKYVTFGILSFCFWTFFSLFCGIAAGWLYIRSEQNN